MPYIEHRLRDELGESLNTLFEALEGLHESERPGAINYCFSCLIRDLYPKANYRKMNEVMGVLECVKQEYYRKVVAPYEEVKEKENGSL